MSAEPDMKTGNYGNLGRDQMIKLPAKAIK